MEISKLIGETSEYEKKRTLEVKEPKSWLKSVSAFANGKGGKIIFGIDDKDNIVGLDNYIEDSEKISEIIKQHMDPIPKFSLSFKSVNKDTKVIVLNVKKGDETPYYFKDKNNQVAYMRVGNETIPCDFLTMNTLILNGMDKTYDSVVSKYFVKDYTFNSLINAFKTEKNKTITIKDLESLDLARGEFLTYAGILFADNCPLRHSRIFCTRWNGLDMCNDATDSIDIEHLSLIDLLHEGVKFIDKHNNKGWIKLNFGRREYVSYPDRAVFEGLCNALIHRDYLQLGSEVHIDMYDDRLEIYSPGGMYGGGNIQDEEDIFNVQSKRRNPILADIFGRLDYIERRGSGFKKIINDYRNHYSKNDPKFNSNKYDFVLTLNNIQYDDKKAGALPGAQPGSLAGSQPGSLAGSRTGVVSNAVVIKDIINNKISDNEYYVYFDALSSNRKYDNHIMMFCLKPRSRADIQKFIGYKSTSHMKINIIKPLLEAGYLCLTNPDVPNDMNQKYYTNPKYIFKK